MQEKKQVISICLQDISRMIINCDVLLQNVLSMDTLGVKNYSL